MKALIDAALDGRAFCEIDPRAILLEAQVLPTLGAPLPRVSGGMRVRLGFEVHEQDAARRRAVLSRVYAWAEGGRELTLSSRPSERLFVRLRELPESSTLRWGDRLTLVFDAPFPYWEAAARRIALRGTSGEGALSAEGLGSFVAAQIRPEATLRQLELCAGATRMTFLGLDVPAGGTLSLSYDAAHVLHLTDPAPRLLCRTPQSADDLFLPPGRGRVFFSSDAPCTVEFVSRGLRR